MVKVQAPALSLDASGALAGAMVFSKWKGRNYLRSLVKPNNPRSGGQTGMRASFKFLSQNWSGIVDFFKATWEAPAEENVVSPFNAFMKYNLLRSRNFLSPTVRFPSPDFGTIDAIDVFTATAGVRQITIGINAVPPNGGVWGFFVYRSKSTGFTPAFDNLITIITANSTTEVTFVDTPLKAGTYYYNAKPFNINGLSGSLDGQIAATLN